MGVGFGLLLAMYWCSIHFCRCKYLLSKEKRDPHEEVQFKHSEAYGTMHEFVMGNAGHSSGSGTGSLPSTASGDLNMIKDRLWYLGLVAAGLLRYVALCPTDVMLIVNYTLIV